MDLTSGRPGGGRATNLGRDKGNAGHESWSRLRRARCKSPAQRTSWRHTAAAVHHQHSPWRHHRASTPQCCRRCHSAFNNSTSVDSDGICASAHVILSLSSPLQGIVASGENRHGSSQQLRREQKRSRENLDKHICLRRPITSACAHVTTPGNTRAIRTMQRRSVVPHLVRHERSE